MTASARIQSHATPARHLRQHVAEVLAAAEAIVDDAGDGAWRTAGRALVDDIARLHDLGKGSAAFQSYIADPEGWRGDPRAKSHTLLSLVLVSAWCEAAGVDGVGVVARALAVKGHHGGQPCDDATLHGTLSDSEMRDVLLAQLATVDASLLSEESRLAPPLPAPSDPLAMIRGAGRTLRRALAAWRAQTEPDMLRARVLARAAYAVLLEADKAFLAVDRAVVRAYLDRARAPLRLDALDAFCAALPPSPMQPLRERARTLAAEGFARHAGDRLLTLTLPTGAGKTLVAARWAVAERAGHASPPTVIVALPMLSILDQTERVYRTALGIAADDGEALLVSHSLADRTYDPELDQGTADFFVDTWRSEVVITTFDQLLLALYSDRAKHALRYHRLLHARIILDEAQYIPPALWTALSRGLAALTTEGSTRVLAMSATPAPCVDGAVEVLDDPGALYATLSRYALHLRLKERMPFDAFVRFAGEFCMARARRGERVLVTVNVRGTAQHVLDALDAQLGSAGLDPAWLLSGDMTPSHRLRVIDAIRARERDGVVVVSTQCVEAGVDLDMHHVIRDLAPLESLVQIAGRCNRHGLRVTPGTVTVVHVQSPDVGDDAACIYDPVTLYETRSVLGARAFVEEREVLALCQRYYEGLRAAKNLGADGFARWLRVEGEVDVRALLRGEDARSSVLVLEQDPTLAGALVAAFRIDDRWARRAALRALGPRVSRVSVSVSQRVFERLRTRPLGCWTALAPGQYDARRGIDGRSAAATSAG